MASLVSKLHSEQALKQKLSDATTKLVVLEFVKPGSLLCEYVKAELENIAEQLQDKAEFCELDVDKFKSFAEKFKIEALPAFVVMQKFVKKRRVVGTDDLKKAIENVYHKFQIDNDKDVYSRPNNDSEQRQAEASNSANNVQSGRNKNGSEPEQPGPKV